MPVPTMHTPKMAARTTAAAAKSARLGSLGLGSPTRTGIGALLAGLL